MKHGMRGVTLLNLLIAIAIIGILGGIAYPSYTAHVVRANRTAAKTVLLQVAERQEQYFADNKQYASDLTELGYPDNGFMVDDQAAVVGDADTGRLYLISLSNTSAMTFTVSAAPQLAQADRDTQCRTLTLTHMGQRGHTGGGTDCW